MAHEGKCQHVELSLRSPTTMPGSCITVSLPVVFFFVLNACFGFLFEFACDVQAVVDLWLCCVRVGGTVSEWREGCCEGLPFSLGLSPRVV